MGTKEGVELDETIHIEYFLEGVAGMGTALPRSTLLGRPFLPDCIIIIPAWSRVIRGKEERGRLVKLPVALEKNSYHMPYSVESKLVNFQFLLSLEFFLVWL